ncbi:carbohydrate kinase family protein [Escherichia coli]|nr:carbohydrate kinase family protein [Escherichia coli]
MRDLILQLSKSSIYSTKPIPIIDTTGAGDTFNGAFVYSLIKNMPLIEALKFASATAAINITALGARGHLATPSEVNLFLSQHD